MNNTIPVPRYTYEDYAQWKEDWELIGGYPSQLLPKTWKENTTQLNCLMQCLEQVNDSHCYAFSALDWIINNNTVVRPDVMIVCGEMKSDYLEFPPVLIIEILSQGSIQRDRNIKFELYRQQGVKYYLMIDYTRETVEVFELIDNFYKSVDKNNFVLTDTYSVEFTYKEVFKK